MADTLKSYFNERMIRSIAADLKRAHPALDLKRFVRECLAGIEEMELTQRGAHVAEVMRQHLPPAYEDAVEIIIASLGAEHSGSESFGFEPFRYMPHATFIARHGLEHFELSMRAQHELTRRFTAEGSIRPYLVRHPERTLARLREWTQDADVHVRRLVSEGTRPRLPWSPRLRHFQNDPTPVLALLELLKDDPERYVQRSVANNLNDIAKDHPDRVVEVARRWMKEATEGRRWIVGHALRSLVKQGHPGALAVLGAGGRPRVEIGAARLTPKRVAIGGTLAFAFELRSTAKSKQTLMIDYAVHFVKSNGERRPKVFKLKKIEIAAGETVQLAGRVSFAPMTTRKPYAGRHTLEAKINGVAYPIGDFDVRA